MIALAKSDHGALLLELNSETDFVARNDAFRQLAVQLAQSALNSAEIRSAAAAVSSFEVPEAVLRELRVEGGKKYTRTCACTHFYVHHVRAFLPANSIYHI